MKKRPHRRVSLPRRVQLLFKIARRRHGVRFGQLFLTRECNLSCPYCATTRVGTPDMGLDGWRAAIDRLHSWDVRLFILSGGEATMREDLEDIVAHIAGSGGVMWLNTNCTLLDRVRVRRLAAAGLQFLETSFDSVGEFGHTDPHALDMVEYARSCGVVPIVDCIISKQNLHEIKDIAEHLASRGIYLTLDVHQHVGGCFSSDDRSMRPTDREALRDLIDWLKRKKRERGHVILALGRYLDDIFTAYMDQTWHCDPERDLWITVNNDGRLMPCQEYLSDLSILRTERLDTPAWREFKRRTVGHCPGCYYDIYYLTSTVRRPRDEMNEALSWLRMQ